MNSPLDIEIRSVWHREDLMREAAAERLAIDARGRSSGFRARIAAVLCAIAEWLDADEVQLQVTHSTHLLSTTRAR